MRIGPTQNIISFARSQPGGVISWSEACGKYRELSSAARHDRVGHFHMNVGNIFQRYFVKVQGARGLYVLKELLQGED